MVNLNKDRKTSLDILKLGNYLKNFLTDRIHLIIRTSIKHRCFELLNPHEWFDRVHANQEHARQQPL